ncbi:hypothetical protein CEXT_218951 [Caerostris extrusa]|uniref:Uncharacterized protein n=1 Tax=Caerostris extrusa TaxID=172846 RepID=A0AAV4UI89_CAEEX|nr:hypothetical protein CEXT_218951 [Caerostris extrusa]
MECVLTRRSDEEVCAEVIPPECVVNRSWSWHPSLAERCQISNECCYAIASEIAVRSFFVILCLQSFSEMLSCNVFDSAD